MISLSFESLCHEIPRWISVFVVMTKILLNDRLKKYVALRT